MMSLHKTLYVYIFCTRELCWMTPLKCFKIFSVSHKTQIGYSGFSQIILLNIYKSVKTVSHHVHIITATFNQMLLFSFLFSGSNASALMKVPACVIDLMFKHRNMWLGLSLSKETHY